MHNSPPTILLVGGGSAGHVAPCLAIREALKENAHCIMVISPEETCVSMVAATNAQHVILSAPRFPRGCAICAVRFPFAALFALLSAWRILRRFTPDVVFAKGGAVSVPVALIAWLSRIPLILHCSDRVPSLGDRLLSRLAKTTCTGFPEMPLPRTVHTGNPVRSSFHTPSQSAGYRLTRFSGKRPVLLVMGGSQGARAINDAVLSTLPQLLDHADIIHITGIGKGNDTAHARYVQYDFVIDALPHLLAIADVVVTRCGAGALAELAVAHKAAILLPLTGVAHDHQVRNAEWLATRDAGILLREGEEHRIPHVALELLGDERRRRAMGEALASIFPRDAAQRVARIILDAR